MPKSARQVVDDAYAALLGGGDLEGFLADFDADSELIEAKSLPYGGQWHGKDAIRDAIQNVLGYWRDFAFVVEQVTEGDDWVIAYGEFSATSVKTDAKVAMPLTEVWRIRDGKVRLLFPIYSDTHAALQVLGLAGSGSVAGNP